MEHLGPFQKKTIPTRANLDRESQNEAKDILDKVLSQLVTIAGEGDLGKYTLDEILGLANVSRSKYEESLKLYKTKATITYKRNADETFISPYNTTILATLQANMNIQYVTNVYAVLVYLTSYLCKAEHSMSELMKKAAKEVDQTGVRDKLRAIGKVFVDKRHVSHHECVDRLTGRPFRPSNVDVVYIHTGPPEERTVVLKPKCVLDTMNDDDTDIYAVGFIERYASRPVLLENMCLADFVSNYKPMKAIDADPVEETTIEGYLKPVAGYIFDEDSDPYYIRDNALLPKIISLQDGLGEMRKRNPCVPRSHIISKNESPEKYYMRLLQLYWPWRNINKDLKHVDGTYISKFDEVKHMIEG